MAVSCATMRQHHQLLMILVVTLMVALGACTTTESPPTEVTLPTLVPTRTPNPTQTPIPTSTPLPSIQIQVGENAPLWLPSDARSKLDLTVIASSGLTVMENLPVYFEAQGGGTFVDNPVYIQDGIAPFTYIAGVSSDRTTVTIRAIIDVPAYGRITAEYPIALLRQTLTLASVPPYMPLDHGNHQLTLATIIEQHPNDYQGIYTYGVTVKNPGAIVMSDDTPLLDAPGTQLQSQQYALMALSQDGDIRITYQAPPFDEASIRNAPLNTPAERTAFMNTYSDLVCLYLLDRPVLSPICTKIAWGELSTLIDIRIESAVYLNRRLIPEFRVRALDAQNRATRTILGVCLDLVAWETGTFSGEGIIPMAWDAVEDGTTVVSGDCSQLLLDGSGILYQGYRITTPNPDFPLGAIARWQFYAHGLDEPYVHWQIIARLPVEPRQYPADIWLMDGGVLTVDSHTIPQQPWLSSAHTTIEAQGRYPVIADVYLPEDELAILFEQIPNAFTARAMTHPSNFMENGRIAWQDTSNLDDVLITTGESITTPDGRRWQRVLLLAEAQNLRAVATAVAYNVAGTIDTLKSDFHTSP